MVELSQLQQSECYDSSTITRPLVSSDEIKPQAKFYSFADFEMTFDRWKLENHHPFRVASSETLRMPDGSSNALFKYRYIVYHCAHYGNPRMRGVGKRPNQNYLPCGCKAMLRLNYSWSENALRITTLNAIHSGHEVSHQAFSKFCNKPRRSFNASQNQQSNYSNTTLGSSTVGSPSPTNTDGSVGTGTSPSRGSSSSPVPPVPSLNMMSHIAPIPQHSAFRPPMISGPNPILNNLAHTLLMRQHQHQLQSQDPLQTLMASMIQNNRNMTSSPIVPPPINPFANATNATLLALLSRNSLPNLPESVKNEMATQATPIDLSSKHKDGRTDDDRFQVVHPVLQNLTDHLITCQGNEFDSKMMQLNTVINSWQNNNIKREEISP